MSVTFEDGSIVDGDDLFRLLSIIKQRAKEGKPKPKTIKVEGVTIKVDGLEPKANGKGPDHENFIESSYKGWKIRVWRVPKDKVYGCNYFRGEDCRYLELRCDQVLDENGVFKYAEGMIDDI